MTATEEFGPLLRASRLAALAALAVMAVVAFATQVVAGEVRRSRHPTLGGLIDLDDRPRVRCPRTFPLAPRRGHFNRCNMGRLSTGADSA
jgi:hypothetical protein